MSFLILQQTRPAADTLSFVFLMVALQLKFVVSFLSIDPGLLSAHAFCLLELVWELHKEPDGCKGGDVWFWHAMYWGWLWVSWDDPWVKFFPWLKLPVGVQIVSRNLILYAFWESYMLLSWTASLPGNRAAFLMLWMLWQSNESLQQCSRELGKPGLYSLILLFPREENYRLSSLAQTVPPLVRGDNSKDKLLLLPTSICPNSFVLFCFLQRSAGTSLLENNFQKAISLDGDYLSYCSAVTPRLQLRGESQFIVSCT